MRALGLASALAIATWLPPLFAHGSAEVPTAPVGDETYWPGPAVSGAWFDPARSGEGFILEYLINGEVLVIWFTYPPAGEPGQQAWMIASGGRISGNHVVFDQVVQASGGVWGDAFDPADIVNRTWGTLDFEFHDCNAATVRYAGPAAYGSGERSLARLTALDQLDCAGTRALTPNGGRALAGLRGKSGAWFVPSRSGEGWFIEEIFGERTVVYWFAYDPQGRSLWMVGNGQREGDRVVITDMMTTRGARFGDAFDPDDVENVPWGRVELAFSNCNTVNVHYASTLAGYGTATRTATRITAPAGATCIDGTPAPPASGTWTELSRMPEPAQSELDVAALDGQLYALSGFGDPRGFKRYDPATRRWTTLARLPAGRDHLSAFALGGGVYYTGGARNGDGDQSTSGFRYDVASGTWEARPELPFNFGSHAALLNGRVFIGTDNGNLWEYDPRQRIKRSIARPDTTGRDHSQVIAFLGEIWMIAGRSSTTETASVAIYDPASERWRVGPRIGHFRGGFAATVANNRIVIGGGEVLHGGTPRIEPTTEIYVPGADRWTFGPALPVPVHGVAAGTIGDRTYFVSGSTNAGSARGATGRLFELALDEG